MEERSRSLNGMECWEAGDVFVILVIRGVSSGGGGGGLVGI